MRNFKLGDWVTVTDNEDILETTDLDVRVGDVGVVTRVWTNTMTGKHGCDVRLSAFYTDIPLEHLREYGDGNFDESTMSYQFFEDELILATECEKEENSILEAYNE